MIPGLAVPGVLVFWAALGVPAFIAARLAARRRIEQEGAAQHGVTRTQYREIRDAFERAVAEKKSDFTDVARAVHEDLDALSRSR